MYGGGGYPVRKHRVLIGSIDLHHQIVEINEVQPQRDVLGADKLGDMVDVPAGSFPVVACRSALMKNPIPFTPITPFVRSEPLEFARR